MNSLKTLILLATLTALLIWAGHALVGRAGFVIALGMAAAMNFGTYWFSDRIVLRLYGAQEFREADAPWLAPAVRELALRGNLPMPKLYLIPEDAPNAFATGRNPDHAAVAVTQGLIGRLDRQEVAAVIAHELGHIGNRDTLIMTLAATIAGALGMLANMALWGAIFGAGRSSEDREEGSHPLTGLLGVLIAPIAAALIQMAISRSREFLADAEGARLTGNPMALAGALRRIEYWSLQAPMQSGSPATAHLCIVNPFSGGGMMRLFSTHPPTEVRIARLKAMAVSGYPVAV